MERDPHDNVAKPLKRTHDLDAKQKVPTAEPPRKRTRRDSSSLIPSRVPPRPDVYDESENARFAWTLETLPDEVLAHILDACSFPDLCRLRLVSTRLHAMACDPTIASRVLGRDVPACTDPRRCVWQLADGAVDPDFFDGGLSALGVDTSYMSLDTVPRWAVAMGERLGRHCAEMGRRCAQEAMATPATTNPLAPACDSSFHEQGSGGHIRTAAGGCPHLPPSVVEREGIPFAYRAATCASFRKKAVRRGTGSHHGSPCTMSDSVFTWESGPVEVDDGADSYTAAHKVTLGYRPCCVCHPNLACMTLRLCDADGRVVAVRAEATSDGSAYWWSCQYRASDHPVKYRPCQFAVVRNRDGAIVHGRTAVLKLEERDSVAYILATMKRTGLVVAPDGLSVYHGPLSGGRREGPRGVLYYRRSPDEPTAVPPAGGGADRTIYKGTWRQDEPHGKGTLRVDLAWCARRRVTDVAVSRRYASCVASPFDSHHDTLTVDPLPTREILFKGNFVSGIPNGPGVLSMPGVGSVQADRWRLDPSGHHMVPLDFGSVTLADGTRVVCRWDTDGPPRILAVVASSSLGQPPVIDLTNESTPATFYDECMLLLDEDRRVARPAAGGNGKDGVASHTAKPGLRATPLDDFPYTLRPVDRPPLFALRWTWITAALTRPALRFAIDLRPSGGDRVLVVDFLRHAVAAAPVTSPTDPIIVD
jgi:hypothetical protein